MFSLCLYPVYENDATFASRENISKIKYIQLQTACSAFHIHHEFYILNIKILMWLNFLVSDNSKSRDELAFLYVCTYMYLPFRATAGSKVIIGHW